MKKALPIALALACVVALSLPALASDTAKDKDVKLTGWITDEWCGEKNANADGAGCAKACAKKGAQLVLFSDGKIYTLSDQKVALEHVGHKVLVTGKMDGEDAVKVKSIEQVKDAA